MPKLSAESRRKIAESMRKTWAARRAAQQGIGAVPEATPVMTNGQTSQNHAGTAIERALSAIRTLTVGDMRSLAQRKGSAQQVTELAQLATELKGFFAPAARPR